MTLEDLGWNAAFDAEFAPYRREGWQPARLIRDNKITYGALLADGEELEVTMGGKVPCCDQPSGNESLPSPSG